MHPVTLVFEDGRAVRILAAEKDSVAMAALRQKVRLATDCLEGTCATCKARCVEGRYRLGDHAEEALSPAEEAAGWVLTCQMHVQGPCVVEVGYDSRLALARRPPEERQARVAAVDRVSATVVRLELALETAVDFLPGQYVNLTVPGTEARRSYSFANPARDGARPEFFVRLLPGGVMSDWVSGAARPGDPIVMTGPFGRFYLRPPRRPILMVAGGTGLAPILSMLDELAARAAPVPVRLLYGVNEPAEAFGNARLEAAGAAGVDLAVERAAVRPGPGWTGAAGLVTQLLRPEQLHGGDVDVYLCGPPPMIEAAEGWLAARGIAPGRIFAERFLPS